MRLIRKLIVTALKTAALGAVAAGGKALLAKTKGRTAPTGGPVTYDQWRDVPEKPNAQ